MPPFSYTPRYGRGDQNAAIVSAALSNLSRGLQAWGEYQHRQQQLELQRKQLGISEEQLELATDRLAEQKRQFGITEGRLERAAAEQKRQFEVTEGRLDQVQALAREKWEADRLLKELQRRLSAVEADIAEQTKESTVDKLMAGAQQMVQGAKEYLSEQAVKLRGESRSLEVEQQRESVATTKADRERKLREDNIKRLGGALYNFRRIEGRTTDADLIARAKESPELAPLVEDPDILARALNESAVLAGDASEKQRSEVRRQLQVMAGDEIRIQDPKERMDAVSKRVDLGLVLIGGELEEKLKSDPSMPRADFIRAAKEKIKNTIEGREALDLARSAAWMSLERGLGFADTKEFEQYAGNTDKIIDAMQKNSVMLPFADFMDVVDGEVVMNTEELHAFGMANDQKAFRMAVQGMQGRLSPEAMPNYMAELSGRTGARPENLPQFNGKFYPPFQGGGQYQQLPDGRVVFGKNQTEIQPLTPQQAQQAWVLQKYGTMPRGPSGMQRQVEHHKPGLSQRPFMLGGGAIPKTTVRTVPATRLEARQQAEKWKRNVEDAMVSGYQELLDALVKVSGQAGGGVVGKPHSGRTRNTSR